MLGFDPHSGFGILENIKLMDHEIVAEVIKNILDQ